MDILNVILAGTAGSLLMLGVLKIIYHFEIVEANMVRAIGSAFTKNEKTARTPGFILYMIGGYFFAILYTNFIPFFLGLMTGDTTAYSYLGMGVVLGMGHGVVVSFMLIIVVAQHHPLEKFRQAGIGVAIAHLFAHLFYGGATGYVLGLLVTS